MYFHNGLITLGNWKTWAVFSPCYQYRYALGRFWSEEGPVLVACCTNPSTATHDASDPTVNKVCFYGRRERCAGVIMVNAYALRSTSPLGLYMAVDPIGPANDAVLDELLDPNLSTIRLGGWGRTRWRFMRPRFEALRARGDWLCLAVTQDGQPKHPLYQRNDASLHSLAQLAPELSAT